MGAEVEGTTAASAEEALVEGPTSGVAFFDGVAGVTVGVPGVTSDGKGLSIFPAVAVETLASSAEEEDEEREEA